MTHSYARHEYIGIVRLARMDGERAPDFCLPDAEGKKHCLGDFRGKWVVLYFYPRDNTSGCTRDGLAAMMSKKDWDDVINVHLSGFFHVVRPVLKE